MDVDQTPEVTGVSLATSVLEVVWVRTLREPHLLNQGFLRCR